jgi:hypothetical protein
VRGFVKKKTVRIVGIVTVLTLALVIGVVTAMATTTVSTAQAMHSPLSVAVMCTNGADPNKVIATIRAVQACGFNVYGIDALDITGEIFYTLKEAQILIVNWRRLYNGLRPHSSLGQRPPAPETIVWPGFSLADYAPPSPKSYPAPLNLEATIKTCS